MTGEELPRFKVRALPPIGKREPGNSVPQLVRVLVIIGLSGMAAAMTLHPPRFGDAQALAQSVAKPSG